eukprot:2936649-Prorocentrum_lima.AAC.1
MSKAVNLGQQVPAQPRIEHRHIQEGGHHIVLKSSLDLIEINGHLATILKGLTPHPQNHPGQMP